MARPSELNSTGVSSVVVRMSNPERQQLLRLVFSRYPTREWATFVRFGWRDTGDTLALTLASIEAPRSAELDEGVDHVAILEPYTLRIALHAEAHPLAVGVVHSHPEGCPPVPSLIDDDMDTYLADYLSGFAPGRPYVSLIVSVINGQVVFGGRVFHAGRWHPVARFSSDSEPAHINPEDGCDAGDFETVARLAAAFGDEAARRLREATVGVVGAGGTGSAAIEVLARAGVGRLIIVDPDNLEASNLERVHGSWASDVDTGRWKSEIARDHVNEINRKCEVVAIRGALPQELAVDKLVEADVVMGCTDQQHSRLALSDLVVRYLIPAIDCGVALEGSDGVVRGQVVQLLRWLPADPCAVCRGIVNPRRVSQELMSEQERESRRLAAQAANPGGKPDSAYWEEVPQLNTVGYLTTTAGALAAGYVVGWVTGRFAPPFERIQMNLSAHEFEVIAWEQEASNKCACRRVRGWGDQGNAEAWVSAPSHWPPAEVL
ncbi:ThiF family adenylyltransferase [Candidatus Palauibacter sp.]|uniref:ThiF family adenylyltransferase n=1 Tax=Candidatus Palauibacter sp. TaxID=3101350 RepID=UPI003B5AD904